MTKNKVKNSPKSLILTPLIVVIAFLSGCGGGDGEPDWTPSLGDLNSRTYVRPIDDDLPQGDYNITFVSSTLTATVLGNPVSFTYTESSKKAAIFTFNLPSGTITDTLTFTGPGVGTFVSTGDNDTVTGSFSISTAN